MEFMFSIYITYYSIYYGVDPSLVQAIVYIESKFDPTATGEIGEIGLMQIRPEYWKGPINLYDPETNIAEGTRRLANLKRLEDRLGDHWYVAYNMGATGAIEYSKSRDIASFSYAKKIKQRVAFNSKN